MSEPKVIRVGWGEIRIYPCGSECWAAASTKHYEDGGTDRVRFARDTKEQAIAAIRRYIAGDDEYRGPG